MYGNAMSRVGSQPLLDEERLGLLFAGLCAVNGAFVPAFAKLTTSRADPFLVATITSCFAGLLALIVLTARGELRHLVGWQTGPKLFIVGTLGTATAFLLLYSGVRRSSAIETVLCLQVEPAYSLLFSWWFLGHRPTRRRIIAISVILAGIFLAVGGSGVSFSSGVWFLLLTPLCWQVSHLIVLRGIGGVRPAIVTGARYIYGGLVLAAYSLFAGEVRPIAAVFHQPTLLWLLAWQGCVLSFVGTLLWYSSISRLDLGRSTAIVVPSIPVLSLIASFLLLGEIPTIEQAIGILCTAAGVLAFVTAPGARAASERIPTLTAPVAAVRDRGSGFGGDR